MSPKFIIVLLVALIVLGPQQLSTVARFLGRFIAQMRKLLHSAQKELQALTWEKEKEPTTEQPKEQ